jgi:hypothetical protein
MIRNLQTYKPPGRAAASLRPPGRGWPACKVLRAAPRNWAIEASGVWRLDEVGDREGDADWVAAAERMIERARTAQAAIR